MSDNPLDPSPEDEQRIRERAYFLWEQEGRPEGRDLDYWERARELQAMRDHAGAALEPNPMAQNYGELPRDQPVEQAWVQENLGEFPDRLADQGEHRTVPMPKDEAIQVLRDT